MHALLRKLYENVCRVIFLPRENEELIVNASIENVCVLFSPQQITCGNETITALLPYRLPLVQACILEAKFHHNARAYEFLGIVLADYLHQLADTHSDIGIVLIPVPLGAKRRKERGYNQVEEAAKAALSRLREPYSQQFVLAPQLLTRTRNTSPQMELGRAKRLTNVRGAFASSRPQVPPHLIYVVLDDVLTTGATLTAAAAALRAAGATYVSCLSLAH